MTDDQNGNTPPRGWQTPPTTGQMDADAVAQLFEQLLSLVPAEVRLRLAEAARQLLEALRAVIDWCVARLEHSSGASEVEVRDIPIL